jgi:hypothetical protein
MFQRVLRLTGTINVWLYPLDVPLTLITTDLLEHKANCRACNAANSVSIYLFILLPVIIHDPSVA